MSSPSLHKAAENNLNDTLHPDASETSELQIEVTSRRPLNQNATSSKLTPQVRHPTADGPDATVTHYSQESLSQLPSTVPESNVPQEQSLARLRQHSFSTMAGGIMKIMGEEDNEPDDTQPLSQSVYETFNAKSAIVAASRVNRDSQHPSIEQDSGHVDLLSSFKPGAGGADDEDEQEDATSEFNFSPTQTQPPLPRLSSSQRFKTPATVGKKRDFTGRTIDRTSPFVNNNPFASATKTPGAVMGLSQLFQATQAVSSPIANLRSEPSDRPSPNIDLMDRPTTATSPLSPIKDMSPIQSRVSLPRAVTEPSADYVSMKLSQAERQKFASTAPQDEENSDDGFDEPSLVERQRKQREIERRIKEQLTSLTASSRELNGMSSSLRQSRRNRATADFSPAAAAEKTPVQERGNETEDETDKEDRSRQANDVASRRSRSEEDKENIDIPIQVPRTNAKLQSALHPPDSSPLSSRIHSRGRDTDGIASFAIADSQRSHPDDDRPGNRARVTNTLPSSAGDMIIPQSQVVDQQSAPISSRESGGANHNVMGQEDHGQGSPDTEARDAQGKEGVDESRRLANTIAETMSSGEVPPKTYKTGHLEPTLTVPGDSKNDTSDGSSKFHTAQTEVSSLRENSSHLAEAASPGNRGSKRTVDMMMQPSPDDATDEFDPDLGIFTAEDHQILQIMGSSPIPPGRRTKRQRVQAEISTMSSPLRSSLPFAPDEPRQDIFAVVPRLESPDPLKVGTRGTQASRSSRPRGIWDVTDSPPKKKPMGQRSRAIQRQIPDSSDKSSDDREVQPPPLSSARVQNDVPDTPFRNIDMADARTVSTADADEPTSLPEMIRPNQILAGFDGSSRAYYPARFLSVASSEPLRYRIQWEGYDPDEIDSHRVSRLELKVGDAVKVNVKGMPKISYIVRSFKKKVEDENIMTDVFGYTTVVVAPKQRKSLPADLSSEKCFDVKISDIYLDSNMWAQFRDRDISLLDSDRAGTPGSTIRLDPTATPNTPPSRSRRERATFQAETAETSLFGGILFAISVDESNKRASWTTHIRLNGGMILEEDFEELFEPSSVQITTPSKRSGDRRLSDLTIKPAYRNASFAVLITDDVSRKIKYMQALALGIPCLHGAWILECAEKGSIVPWQSYLLAAGRSKLLGGAMRSRSLLDFAPETSKLRSRIESRPLPLHRESIIFVMGRSKTEERRKAYMFLIRAMGAREVQRTYDLKTAMDLIAADSAIRYLVVDDKEVASARSEICGQSIKKRLSSSANNEPNVVGTDFIAQSLILGQLFKE